jgi:transposase
MRTRRRFSSEFKAKVALVAIQGPRDGGGLATRHGLQPTQIAAWKREAVEKLAQLFDEKNSARDLNRDAGLTSCMPRSASLSWSGIFLSKAFVEP